MSSNLQRQNMPKSNGGGNSTNLVNGSSIQFEYNNQNQSQISTNETTGTKKNKKKKKKSKSKKSNGENGENGETINELSFNDPDFVYPDSRILKQNSNGDVIVQSLEPQHQTKSNPSSVNNTIKSSKNSKNNSDKLIPDDQDDLNEQLKEYWSSLSPDEKKNLLNLERDSVFKVMKEQQRITCNCSVCGRKREIIEQELKNLYDNYFDGIDTQELIAAELFNINNKQQNQFQKHKHDQQIRQNNLQNRSRNGSSSNIQQHQQQVQQHQQQLLQQQQRAQKQQQQQQQQQQQSQQGQQNQQNQQNQNQQNQQQAQRSNRSSETQRRNGIMSVAEDLLQNDGKKFLEMMEKLAESRIQRQNQYNRKIESYGSNATNNQIEEEEEEESHDYDNEDAFEDDEDEEDEEVAEYDDEDDEYFESESEHVQYPQQGVDSEYLEEDQLSATTEKERRVLIQLQLQRQRELQSQLQREKQELRVLQDDALDNIDDSGETHSHSTHNHDHDFDHDDSEHYIQSSSRSINNTHQQHSHVHPHQHEHQGHHQHHHGLEHHHHNHNHQQGQSDMDEDEDDLEEELDDEEEEDDEAENEDYSDDGIDEEQQLEEGRQMLQLCTTKMLRQSLLEAYKRKKQEEYTKALLEEMEKEEALKKQKEEKKHREREKKKEKKRILLQQKEEERLKKEAEERRKEEEREAENKRKQQEGMRKKLEADKKKAEEKRRRELIKREKEEQKQKLAQEKKKKLEEEALKKEQEEQRLREEKLEKERKAKEEIEMQELLKKQKVEDELRRQQQLKDEKLALEEKLRSEELLKQQQAQNAQPQVQSQQVQSQPQFPPHLPQPQSQQPLQQQPFQQPLQQQRSQFFEGRSSSIASNPEFQFAQAQQQFPSTQPYVPNGTNRLFENLNHQANSQFISSPLASQVSLNRQSHLPPFSSERNDTPPGLTNLGNNFNGFGTNGLDSQIPISLFDTNPTESVSPWGQSVRLSKDINPETFSPFPNPTAAVIPNSHQQPQNPQSQQQQQPQQPQQSQFAPPAGNESLRSSIDNLTDVFAGSSLDTLNGNYNSNLLSSSASYKPNIWNNTDQHIWSSNSNSTASNGLLPQPQNSNLLNSIGSHSNPSNGLLSQSQNSNLLNPLGSQANGILGSNVAPPPPQGLGFAQQLGTQTQGGLNDNDPLRANYQLQIANAYKICKDQSPPFDEYIDLSKVLTIVQKSIPDFNSDLFLEMCNSRSNSHKFEILQLDNNQYFLKVTEFHLSSELGSAVPRANSNPFNHFNGGNDFFNDTRRSFGNGNASGGLNWGNRLLR
ncbi:Stress response protein NST1 [Wickerhamomyces ciferrii]|uniref:Stress response protein NST1 n=1 Tax=Wickerhamomyces ciferrii (strain ATCC 14091 / BCRC 22168 / CBS 111 / JCM 3599 / NBRC 0793 / NRRL Y-1031 F-60-10) TaxID=1206466 RepID=K0KA46_WICCF|nr:Stress response protein NST1 [Wickerhamomyces ciferrii]CCH41790.1 Stress response protein NST1 [Wickerhamomyces ciferrii]